MEKAAQQHEIVADNSDVGVRVFLSDEPLGFKPLHWHTHIEIVLVLTGEVTFRYEQHDVTLHENEFIVIGSGILHSTTNLANQALVLQIPVYYLNQYWSNSELLRFDLWTNHSLHDKTYDKIVSMLQQMTQIYLRKEAGYRLRFSSILMQVLYDLITNYAVTLTPDDLTEDDRLKDVIMYIHEQYRTKISLSEVAEKFHYNPDYLSRIFKRRVGVTFVNYVYQVRLDAIYQDVLATNQVIKTIFIRHGASNTKLAMKMFKESYGQTPNQLRQLNKGG